MTGSTASATTGRWSAQLMWLLPPLFELPFAAALCSGIPEVAHQAAFGSPATEAVLLLALVAAVCGFAAVARGTAGVAQAAVGGLLSVAAGAVAAIGAGFLSGGVFRMLGLLLAHSAFSIAMLARATLRRPAEAQ
ncbi:hypothetical protein ACFQFC_38990 [Amorphoplanes digitatis]|uniref:Uncharacterized protein n=1 Tax=Actinoplanes digitatis TaxID=1868 RepID=A0A7W7MPH7_9ACTN|nr:hypothetical protein [Actinoplanes digitatis]MBB4762156.1 hypothetical protein [Actinoplanes digitatis]GID96250.1 hypothetical protein Adi01nite_56620 [Actinoplanes digitatis]